MEKTNQISRPLQVPQIKKCKSEEESIFSWKNSNMIDTIKKIKSTQSFETIDDAKPKDPNP